MGETKERHRYSRLMRLVAAGLVFMGVSGCCCCVIPVGEKQAPEKAVAVHEEPVAREAAPYYSTVP